jgi:hypothetical protein
MAPFIECTARLFLLGGAADACGVRHIAHFPRDLAPRSSNSKRVHMSVNAARKGTPCATILDVRLLAAPAATSAAARHLRLGQQRGKFGASHF